MAEETNNPVQTEPVPEPVPAPAAFTPEAPASTDPAPTKQGGGLLVFLTVLLVLVGIADVILWSIVGYDLIRSAQNGSGRAAVQGVSASGTAASGDTEGQAALKEYMREMEEVVKLGKELHEGHNSAIGENYTDNEALYTEVTEHLLPLCQRVKEMAEAVAPSDPEISAAHGIYLDNIAKYLDGLTTLSSALSSEDAGQMTKSNESFAETLELAANYDQAIERLASERGVT